MGGFVVAAIMSFVVGWVARRRARRGSGGGVYGGAGLGAADGEERGRAVGLRWKGISLAVPRHAKDTWFPFAQSSSFRHHNSRSDPLRSPSGEHKLILDGVSGHVAPGSMLAILGPSGAGKTSLIDVLSGQDKRGAVSGSVGFYVPGESGDAEADVGRRVRIGYVDQVSLFGLLVVFVWNA